MTAKSRATLNSDADTNLATNGAGDITAADVRTIVKDLADSAVLIADATTRGDIFIRDASTVTRLPIGTTGQVLTSDGTDPSWQTPGGADVAAAINGATGKTTPVDADALGIVDSAASNVLKKLTWANLKATLKSYFDTLYAATDAGLTALAAFNTNGILVQTADNTFAGRTLTGTSNQITVSNGDGVSGNPTLSLPSDVLIPTVLTVPNTGLHLLDTNASHDLIIKPGSDITADRTLTFTTGDSDRTVTISGNPTISQDYSTTGNPQFATIELGAASDTTLARSSAGNVTIEGNLIYRAGGTDVPITDGGTGASDVAGALTNFGITGKQGIWIPANAMVARTTNGAATGSTEMSTNKNMFATLDFDTTTQEFAQFAIRMPKQWNESTVTFAPVWSHGSTTTNFGVVWGLAGVAISNDDAGDVAFGTAQTSTDTGGTTNDIYEGPESSAITIAGSPAAGDYVMFQIARNPSDGSDTMAIDARLHGIVLFITTDAGNDA